MTDDFCPYEAKTIDAVRSGDWSDELRAHLAGCETCAEARAVAGFMTRIGDALGRREAAPDPTLIWLKAELARQEERSRRERRTWIWSGALSGVAATLTAWASLEWIAPVVAQHADVFALGGGAIALTLGVLYFAVYRPLSNGSR
jgi:hypothetical protein